MEAVRREASKDFKFFVDHIFSASFKDFISGEHIARSCRILQDNNQTIRVSARVHFKSMSLYAHVMWKILQMRYTDEALENHYFSYKAEMAAYHVGSRTNQNNIRSLIQRNPYFQGIVDNKPNAEAMLDYSWRRGGPIFTLTPHGMMTFKRGLHCNGILYVDDPLQDPAEKLDPRTIYKINDIFYTQLLDIPIGDKKEIHVVGTAQTEEDFYFDSRSKELFEVYIMPGVKDLKADQHGYIIGGTPLWPEWMDLKDHILKQKAQGIKTYSQEYLCTPVYSADAFFQKWQLDALATQKPLTSYSAKSGDTIVGGWDLGKHSHPAHFTVNVFNSGKVYQIHDKWFDGVDYTDQLDYIEDMMERLNIETIYYDNTRGELEALEEQAMLPVGLEPINLNLKTKHSLAIEMERHVTQGKWQIIDEPRSIKQMCVVTNDLKARQTKDGHGDSFWSNALTFAGALQPDPDIYIMS